MFNKCELQKGTNWQGRCSNSAPATTHDIAPFHLHILVSLHCSSRAARQLASLIVIFAAVAPRCLPCACQRSRSENAKKAELAPALFELGAAARGVAQQQVLWTSYDTLHTLVHIFVLPRSPISSSVGKSCSSRHQSGFDNLQRKGISWQERGTFDNSWACFSAINLREISCEILIADEFIIRLDPPLSWASSLWWRSLLCYRPLVCYRSLLWRRHAIQ